MDGSNEQKQTNWTPTKAQERLLEVLLEPANRLKTVGEICTLAQIGSRGTYYQAFDNENFVAHYNAKALEMVQRHVGPVMSAFLKEALRGSYQHGLVILEMAGVYVPKSRVEHTVDVQDRVLSQDEVTQRLRTMGLLPTEPPKDTETPH